MTSYNHTPSDKQSPIQANNAQSDSKLIRLKTNLSFVSLIDWTAIILFVGLCVTHCVPAYAETLRDGHGDSGDGHGDTKETLRDGTVTGGDGIGYALVTLDDVTSNRMRNASNVTSNAKSNERNGMSNTKNNQFLLAEIGKQKTQMKLISFKNHLTNGDVGGYYKALSKFNSVTPQRHCGFFVPKVYIGSQPIKLLSAIQFINILSQSQNNPILKNLTLTKLNPFHIWRTPPNKRMRISGAVSVKTESNSIYEPFSRFIFQSQNLTGGQI